MAIIGKIRKHSGLTILFVGVALLAFVIGDLSRGGFGGQNTNVGEILGEDVPYIEFERTVEEQVAISQMNRNQPMTQEETFSVRNQVWNSYISDIVMGNQYKKLGLAISQDEMYDLVAGENPHQYIVSNFTNPQTGAVDKEQVLRTMSNLDQYEAGFQVQVANLFKLMKEDAINTKYRTLLNKGYYAPSAFAEMQYNRNNEKASIEIVQLPYSAIADSTVVLTDADYQKYYNEHKESYKQEETRKLEYIVFDVRPSQADFESARKYITELYNELSALSAIDVPMFINTNTDGAFYDSTWVKKDALAPQIAEAFDNNAPGITIAPYLQGEAYYTSRFMAEAMRSDTMDAEHILIAYQGAMSAGEDAAPTRERAQFLADSLLAVVKKPNSMPFELLVMMHSNDPGKVQNSGKYERFVDGQMVPEFNEAVQNGKKGDVVIAESVFGFHIIKIGEKNAPQKMFRVATIQRDVVPSDATMQVEYMKATKLASENRTIDAFRNAATENNYNVREQDRVQPMANGLTAVTQPRQIIRWAYNKDTKVGDVSPIFETDNQFVVAALSAINPKGYASMETQKTAIQNMVMREKKASMILDKVKGETSTNVNEIATKYSGTVPDAPIQINPNTMSLPNNFGREVEVVGATFGIEQGQFYGPIQGFNGIYFIKKTEQINADPKEDYSEEQTQMQSGFASRAYLYQRELQEKANIKDNRFLFY